MTDPVPFAYDRFEDCPAAKAHAKQPSGYVERSNWSERKLKTHEQLQCPTCGFWVIWRRRR